MAGQLTIDTLKASSGVLATQNGMTGIAKAWVKYNLAGQVLLGSYNVSSITYLTTGAFTINFSTSMPNTNYAVVATTNRLGQGSANEVPMIAGVVPDSFAVGSVTINVGWQPSNALYNTDRVNVAVFS